MKINNNVQKAINRQCNRELYSSYLYLSMSSYCESIGFRGMAQWLKVQAREELEHAMKFYDYVIGQGGRVLLDDIEAPPVSWKGVSAVFKHVYNHEVKVTGLINGLLKVAQKNKDKRTQSMLVWFIKEQVEEEENAEAIVSKIAGIKNSRQGLFKLDKELGKRQ